MMRHIFLQVMFMKALLAAMMLAALLLFPASVQQSCKEALCIWGLHVVPSLFPYMVLCQALSACAALARLPPALITLLLGLIGGSPCASAALSASLPAQKTPSPRIRTLLPLLGTISPMFFLGPAAQWLSSKSDGILLLIAHIAGALLACLIYRPIAARKGTLCVPAQAASAIADDRPDPISRSVNAVMNVGGCIVFFSAAASCIRSAFPLVPREIVWALHGALEIAGGFKALCALTSSRALQLVALSAAAGFGGMSILMQNAFFLRPLGVHMKEMLLCSLLRCACCAAVMAALALFIR